MEDSGLGGKYQVVVLTWDDNSKLKMNTVFCKIYLNLCLECIFKSPSYDGMKWTIILLLVCIRLTVWMNDL